MEKKHVIFLTAMLFASLTIILAVINLKYGSYYPEKFYSYIVFSYVLIGLAFFTAIVSIIAESISCHKHLKHEKIAELEEQITSYKEEIDKLNEQIKGLNDGSIEKQKQTQKEERNEMLKHEERMAIIKALGAQYCIEHEEVIRKIVQSK